MTARRLPPGGIFAALALLLFAPAGLAFPAAARDRAGDFDFYVLSLSWSPTYCETDGRDNRLQCGAGRPYAFVVHGLWPQYERGWPRACPTKERTWLSRKEVAPLTDIMPSPDLIFHEWREHGTCSGLTPNAYFALVRKARERVTIPPAFAHIDRPVTVEPSAVEAAFRKANPGLDASEIAVTCSRNRLSEVRLCLTKDLEFRSCPQVDRNGCRRKRIVMPPVRGSH